MNLTISFNSTSQRQTNWSFPYHAILTCRNTTDITMFLVTLYSMETIIGILGNLCLIGILTKHKDKAIVTNIFIANLIASDLIMCIFCLPFTIATLLMKYWLFGEGMCRMISFIQCTSVTVSILSLVLIALERHQLIINPTGWRPSISQAHLGIAVVWIFSAILSLPFVTNSTLNNVDLAQFHITDSYATKDMCMNSWPSEKYKIIYSTVLLLLQYCIPLILIVVCYLHIYLQLQKREGMFKNHDYSCRRIQLKRINILLACMVVAFAVCWLPLHVFNSIADWDYKMIPNCLHDLIFSLCHLVAMASACINPIIYGFLNKNFKKEVKDLILNCQHRPSLQDYENVPLSTLQTDISKGFAQSNFPQNLTCPVTTILKS
ncbi:neuropeptide Y receptor type 4-2-like [Anolis carolinensis]|uniref:G-protein coupled receptors family 1 profile domain-containing protein n=1 Tax=Anolis carolinensis TaxID=28377 RepID=H9GCZ5_ANOCA|nr:PREDICTED: neuropeptide Y receptor type 4 [Anolis carolinensis]XP_008115944.1 PREDICTED: neuropeptide Y receptor type 4 [Anolis carolinensis]XP_008115945.1 PREDICTED: neuropeptide Y receptor type 4 [Anolis carolinensis]XP_008115946.1 PREDICTED: neuropeptide Y receptor type 4 [Anolis carolinensis]XP_016851728.1 PREDICTED: neuropeptide Y receptor type 4 [Anolis carolinensis]|eukprot:XP_008115943.1 PREDICTED: neuropeptide Y receptor type 4 [Anolis carolinensis]